MTDEDPIRPCASCGREQPRSAMFGVEPDLLCQPCRDGVAKRMHVRFRPHRHDRPPIVTYAVIGLAGVIYLLDHWIFGRDGGPQGPAWWQTAWSEAHVWFPVWAGEVHSLLTSAFFHGFFLHVFFNAWWVLTLGRATESGFGHWQLALLVVGSAMVASGVEWMAGGSGEGLSGVVYALATFLYVHRKTNPPAASVMNRRTLNFLLMWFVLCIVLTQTGTWRVANWAHGAGAVWGWAVGLASLHAQRRWLVPLAALGTVLVVVMTVYVAFGTIKLDDGRRYDRAQLRREYLEQRGRD